MRIGIDARFYGSVGKGLGRYTSELIRHLEQVDTENDYVIFLRRSNFNSYAPKNPRFTKVLAEYPWYSWREQVLYPLFLRKFRLDLVHFPHFNVPFFYRRKYAVTVHDLILLSHPTTRATRLGPLAFWVKYRFYLLVIRRAIADAAAVITVSHWTKKEIIERFPFAKQKNIVVTYEACAPSLKAGEALLPEREKGSPFILYVGNAYPHKNLERLLAAFAKFRNAGHGEWRLVLVGAEDYFYARLKREASGRQLDDRVTFYGHATDEQLASLYRTASFYAFPSLCEGFGLPPLEAMCHGLPVASSKATCMPEILGDAALYFDPNSEDDMAAAFGRMADDDELRHRLAHHGVEHAKKFDWKTCAVQTRAAYMKALASVPPHA
ncbi:MAG TPA: glycosyltransferase family 1 protein [Candidatus Binatia bacterium]|nr:glycosyltransferase family 1 protein [Candidatus Binatia bacterium]